MPVIPQVTIEQIRNANDIVDVIGSFVPLKRAGTNFLGLCPFHKEKTPSFNVNPSKQIFHCFGCHKGGDVFTFIREFENLSFLESVQRLADRARISIDFEMKTMTPLPVGLVIFLATELLVPTIAGIFPNPASPCNLASRTSNNDLDSVLPPPPPPFLELLTIFRLDCMQPAEPDLAWIKR